MYLKVGETEAALYDDFGFDGKAILEGRLPSLTEFGKIVGEKDKKERASGRDEFDQRGFEDKVRKLYKDFAQKAHIEKTPAQPIKADLDAEKAKLQALEQLFSVRSKFHQNFLKDPAGALKEIDRLAKPEKVKTERELDTLIENLKTSDPTSLKYRKAIQSISQNLARSLPILRDDITKSKSRITELENKGKHLGVPYTPRVFHKNVVVTNPLIDPDSLMQALEELPPEAEKPEVKPGLSREPSAELPDAKGYKWLSDPKALDSIIRALQPRPGDIPGSRKERDVQMVGPEIEQFKKDVRSLDHDLAEEIADINKGISTETHMLSQISKDIYGQYKDYRKGLRKKLNPEEYRNLTVWDSTKKFRVPDAELPPEHHKERTRLNSIYDEVQRIRGKVRSDSDKMWKPIQTRIGKLREAVSRVKALYNRLKKEGYLEQLKRTGIVPVELSRKAYQLVDAGLQYVDPAEGLAEVKTAVEALHKLSWGEGDAPDVSTPERRTNKQWQDTDKVFKALLSGDIGDWLEKVADALLKTQNAIRDYYDKIDSFLEGLMTGSSTEQGVKHPPFPEEEKGKSETFRHKELPSQSYEKAKAYLEKTEVVKEWKNKSVIDALSNKTWDEVKTQFPSDWTASVFKVFKELVSKGKKTEEGEKTAMSEVIRRTGLLMLACEIPEIRLAFQPPTMTQVSPYKPGEQFMGEPAVSEKFRSEYPPVVPLAVQDDMGKYVDFFVKSFGGFEKMINWWKSISQKDKGLDTLSPSVVPELFQRAFKFVDEKLEKDYDKKKLEEEKGKLEDRLQAVISSRKADETKLEQLKKWVEDHTKKVDELLSQVEQAGPASGTKVKAIAKQIGQARKTVEKEVEDLVDGMMKDMEADDQEGFHKLRGEYDTLLSKNKADMAKMSEELQQSVGKNASLHKSADALKEEINQFQNTWASVGTRIMNRMEQSVDKQYPLQNAINKIDRDLEQGISEQIRKRAHDMFAKAFWKMLDEHWQGRGMKSMEAFQSRFNLGTMDYKAIMDEIAKVMGTTRLPSRMTMRHEKERKDDRKFQKSHPSSVGKTDHAPKIKSDDQPMKTADSDLANRIASMFTGAYESSQSEFDLDLILR